MITVTRNTKILIILIILFAAGLLLVFFLRGDEDTWIKDKSGNWVKHGNPEVADFESCAARYPVIETYPEQCVMPDGPTFTKSY